MLYEEIVKLVGFRFLAILMHALTWKTKGDGGKTRTILTSTLNGPRRAAAVGKLAYLG